MILFNTHARTGSYLAYQLVLRNLVSSKVIHKHELENIINAIMTGDTHNHATDNNIMEGSKRIGNRKKGLSKDR